MDVLRTNSSIFTVLLSGVVLWTDSLLFIALLSLLSADKLSILVKKSVDSRVALVGSDSFKLF